MNERRQSNNADIEVSQMLEISDKNFKGAVIKMLQEQLQILLKQMKQSHQRNESYGGLITKSCLTLWTV